MSAPVAMHPATRRRLGGLAFAVLATVPPVLWALPAGIAARQVGWSLTAAWNLGLVLWALGWLWGLPLWRQVGASHYNRVVGLSPEDSEPAAQEPSASACSVKRVHSTSARSASTKRRPRPRVEPEDDEDDDDDWPHRRDDDAWYHPESGLRMHGGLDATGRGYGS